MNIEKHMSWIYDKWSLKWLLHIYIYYKNKARKICIKVNIKKILYPQKTYDNIFYNKPIYKFKIFLSIIHMWFKSNSLKT